MSQVNIKTRRRAWQDDSCEKIVNYDRTVESLETGQLRIKYSLEV